MLLQRLGGLGHLLSGDGADAVDIAGRVQPVSAEYAGGIIAFDGSGRIVNAPQTGDQGLLGGAELFIGDLATYKLPLLP